jgi:hypothetical protein
MLYAVILVNDDGIPNKCVVKNSKLDADSLAISIVEENNPTNPEYKSRILDHGWYGETGWLVSVLLAE